MQKKNPYINSGNSKLNLKLVYLSSETEQKNILKTNFYYTFFFCPQHNLYDLAKHNFKNAHKLILLPYLRITIYILGTVIINP